MSFNKLLKSASSVPSKVGSKLLLAKRMWMSVKGDEKGTRNIGYSKIEIATAISFEHQLQHSLNQVECCEAE